MSMYEMKLMAAHHAKGLTLNLLWVCFLLCVAELKSHAV